MKEYERLATHLRKTFKRTSIDLTQEEWFWDSLDPNIRDKVFDFSITSKERDLNLIA